MPLLALTVEKIQKFKEYCNILDTVYADIISEDNDNDLESAKEVAEEKILDTEIDRKY